MNFNGCIAYPCPESRGKGSAFCSEHLEAHNKSLWVKAWKEYQKECSKVGFKNAVFSPPKPVDKDA